MFDPLGMTAASAVITHETRQRLAVGYTPFADDRPFLPGDPLATATWLETGTADGCLAMPAGDLATYLRLLLNQGRFDGGRIVSAASFDMMTQSVIEIAPDTTYGYGLMTTGIDGGACIGHAGGMASYHAMMLGNLEAGLGVVVLANGPLLAPLAAIARSALTLLRAGQRGDPMPDSPPLPDPTRIENAVAYAGTYGDETTTLTITAEGDRLFLDHEDGRIPLLAYGEDTFVAKHPAFALFPLRFGREEGRVVEFSHGSRWYRGDDYSGPVGFAFPADWHAYPGHYRSYNPWHTNIRVVLRKGTLYLVQPTGEEEPLAPLRDGHFRVGNDP